MSDVVERLKGVDIPRLFEHTEFISDFGRNEGDEGAMAELSRIMDGAPVTRLATKIGEVTAMLVDADPKRIAAPQSRWQQFTGRSIEVRVNYHKGSNLHEYNDDHRRYARHRSNTANGDVGRRQQGRGVPQDFGQAGARSAWHHTGRPTTDS